MLPGTSTRVLASSVIGSWNQLKLVCSQRKKEKQAGCRRLTPEIRDADSMEGDS
jgi:hypothetical protein